MKYKRIAIDMDGTLCSIESYADYENAKPKKEIIDIVNMLYKVGIEIIIYTARPKKDRNVTIKWLKKYNISYNQIVFDKLLVDLYVDDKAITPELFKDILFWSEI